MKRLHCGGIDLLLYALMTGKKGGGDRLGQFNSFILQAAFKKQLSLDMTVKTPKGDDSNYLAVIEHKLVESNPTLNEVHRRDMEKLIPELIRRTRRQIKQTWTKINHKRGLKAALRVFDGLCRDDTCSEIARKLDISRERVRQIRSNLVRLTAVKKMKQELRLMRGDE